MNDAERALILEGRKDAGKPAPLSWTTMLRSPTLWCLSVMYLCSNAGWSFFASWITPYLRHDLHLSGIALVLASGAPLFFGGASCLLGGFLTDRQVRLWGPRWGRTLQGVIAYGLGGVFMLVSVALTPSHIGSGIRLAVLSLRLSKILEWPPVGPPPSISDIAIPGTVAGFHEHDRQPGAGGQHTGGGLAGGAGRTARASQLEGQSLFQCRDVFHRRAVMAVRESQASHRLCAGRPRKSSSYLSVARSRLCADAVVIAAVAGNADRAHNLTVHDERNTAFDAASRPVRPRMRSPGPPPATAS